MTTDTKSEVVFANDLNGNFVHCSQLGVSVAYAVEGDDLHLALAFAHKLSPRSKELFEQFSKKKGRSVTMMRLNAHINGAPVPYAVTVPLNGTNPDDIGGMIKKTLLDISNVENCTRLNYEDQIDNDEVLEALVLRFETVKV